MLKQIHKLCKPAYVYLVLSAITIILMMVQNAGASGTYKVGMYQCPCNNTAGIFLGKAIYVAFWTFILNAVCKAGYKSVSWFLVLFPMILGALLVGLVLMSGGIREGISGGPLAGEWQLIAAGSYEDGDEINSLNLAQAQSKENAKMGTNVGINIRKTVDDRAAYRDDLRAEYLNTMKDKGLSDETEGYNPFGFFQSFFEKLVNFLTGKGFQNEKEEEERRLSRLSPLSQTERGRKLLEIKKQQAESPKNATQDELDRFVADTKNEMAANDDGDGNLEVTAFQPQSMQEYKKLQGKANTEETNKLADELNGTVEQEREGGTTTDSNGKKVSWVPGRYGSKVYTTQHEYSDWMKRWKGYEPGKEDENDDIFQPQGAEQNGHQSQPQSLSERRSLDNAHKPVSAHVNTTTEHDEDDVHDDK